ncbi:MAG: cupin domain-containing protein [Alphaproteobacteria bacterium]
MAKSPVFDPKAVPAVTGSGYPEPFRSKCAAREKRRLGDHAGLKNFGVNLVRMPPGVMSAMRHWHTKQDEFIYMIEGELVLLTDAGETVMRPGMAAGFPAGAPDGHCLVNRSDKDAVYLEVGDRLPGDEVDYPGIDMRAAFKSPTAAFFRKDGTPY